MFHALGQSLVIKILKIIIKNKIKAPKMSLLFSNLYMRSILHSTYCMHRTDIVHSTVYNEIFVRK